MKKNILKFSVFMLAVSLTLSSCKKDAKNTPVADDTAQQSTTASDEASISSETEQVANDANAAISGVTSSAGGRIDGNIMNAEIEGATVDTTAFTSTSKTLTITYDGSKTVSDNRIRTGSITVALSGASHWKDMNAMLTITFNNFKVTKVSNNKFFIINGTKTITNVTGGLIKWLGTSKDVTDTIIHHIQSSGLSITFDDNTNRSWNVNRTRKFYGSYPSNLTVVTTGTGSTSSFTNAVTWGTNRHGETFIITIDKPIVSSSNCGWRKPMSGQKTHQHIAKPITVIYGFDQSNGCGTDFKIMWTNDNGVAKSEIINY